MIPKSWVPEDALDEDVLKEVAIETLTTRYFHRRMAEVLGQAGFDVATVEQHWFHNIYEIRMKRGRFDLEKNDVRAARQIRRLFKQVHLHIERDAINVSQYRDRVRLVFVFPFGEEGTLRLGR